MRKRHRENEINYWPGVADCMLGLFMIALILGITTKVAELIPGPDGTIKISIPEYDGLKKDSERLKTIEMELKVEKDARKKAEELLAESIKRCDRLLQENTRLITKIAELEKVISELEKDNDRLKGENDKPPILVVDATKVSFKKGKADLDDANIETLRNGVFEELLATVRKYKMVDTIEIIGHTDSSKVASASNLDDRLMDVLEAHKAINSLTAGSNADLGLMRALAVKQEWVKWLSKKNVSREIHLRCYSAAQGIPPAMVSGIVLDEMARRIEIRFTQLNRSDASKRPIFPPRSVLPQ